MSNNRHLINDFDIVRPAQLLDKGLPIPFLVGKYTVEDGWVAVITEGGAFKEILEPGTHYLDKFNMWRDVKAISIDTRIQTMTVSTQGEFTIQQPVVVEIDLDLSVEYQVSDPRRVALEIKTPLTSLYDRVIQAVRSAVVYATVDEIRTQGEGIARSTLQRLQGMQLPKVIGIEVSNVLVTTIKAGNVGKDALAQQQLKEFTTVRDWQLDSMMTQQSKVTWEWLLMHRPEIAQKYLDTYGMLAKEMIDKGTLDPAGFLNQPLNQSGTPGVNPMNLLGMGGFPGSLGQSQTTQSPSQQIGAGQSGGDLHKRMSEETQYLNGIPGANVQTQLAADGAYMIKMNFPSVSGKQIDLFIACKTGYPQKPPLVDVEVDSQKIPFQSSILQRWSGNYLVEIVREVKNKVG